MLDMVRVQNLSINFRTLDGLLYVIDDANIAIRANEVVALVGETGCGKSVTAKAILGCLPTSCTDIKGSIFFRGNDLQKLTPQLRQRLLSHELSYIPQDPMSSLNPVFRIGTQMTDLLKWQGRKRGSLLGWGRKGKRYAENEAQQEAMELLNKVEIPAPRDTLKRYPCELSGGMRQRVLIAMSLIGNPCFLVADEPTTSLDVSIQKGILELISKSVNEEALTVLFISHDLGVVRKVSDRIYIMYAGSVVESAKTEVLLREPAHPYTQGLLKSVPKLTQGEYHGIPGRLPSYLERGKGCRFYARCKAATEVCQEERPKPITIGALHEVACHQVVKEGR